MAADANLTYGHGEARDRGGWFVGGHGHGDGFRAGERRVTVGIDVEGARAAAEGDHAGEDEDVAVHGLFSFNLKPTASAIDWRNELLHTISPNRFTRYAQKIIIKNTIIE